MKRKLKLNLLDDDDDVKSLEFTESEAPSSEVVYNHAGRAFSVSSATSTAISSEEPGFHPDSVVIRGQKRRMKFYNADRPQSAHPVFYSDNYEYMRQNLESKYMPRLHIPTEQYRR